MYDVEIKTKVSKRLLRTYKRVELERLLALVRGLDKEQEQMYIYLSK